MAELLRHVAFLLGFIVFCAAVGGGIAAFHYGRLALMDAIEAEQERLQRRRNPNIIPLSPQAIRHTIERWYYR